MDSSQRCQPVSRQSADRLDSHFPYRPIVPAPRTNPSSQVAHVFNPYAVFPNAYHYPLYTTSSGGSSVTYSTSSSSASRSNTTDISVSSHTTSELRQGHGTTFTHLLPPGLQFSEPAELEFESSFNVIDHQHGSRSLPNPLSHAVVPPLPPRNYSSGDVERYQRGESQVPPYGVVSDFAHGPTADWNQEHRGSHQQPTPSIPQTTLVVEAEEQPFRCWYFEGSQRCKYIPGGKDPAHLLKIHETRQHKSLPIQCDKEGCTVVIANGRWDNLRKHQDTENCEGFRRRKVAEAAQKRFLDELARQPYPPSFLTSSMGLVPYELQPVSPMFFL
jgi:hypothetical protein